MTRRRILLAWSFSRDPYVCVERHGLADFTSAGESKFLIVWATVQPSTASSKLAAGEDWDVIPIVDFTALPSGTVEHSVLETYWRELETGLRMLFPPVPGSMASGSRSMAPW